MITKSYVPNRETLPGREVDHRQWQALDGLWKQDIRQRKLWLQVIRALALDLLVLVVEQPCQAGVEHFQLRRVDEPSLLEGCHGLQRDVRPPETLDAEPGMVTIWFESELASFKGKLESSLVRFLAHDCLDGPRQRRAF